jgi:hypothetical protein
MLRIFVRAVFASLRRRARTYRKIPKLHCGAVTFLQRYGDALNLNVHFHTLVLDGVYEPAEAGLRFLPLPPPDREKLGRILRRIARQAGRLVEREGADPAMELLADDQPLLAGLAASSIRSRIASGRRAGREVLRRGDRIEPEEMEEDAGRADCVAGGGFSLHAGVAVPARDRRRLERLCRYVGRPPVATQRLSRLSDTRLLYRLRRRWRDGTTHVVFEPQELLEKLVSLVPPPRAHQVRYHGLLAPSAGWRAEIVPRMREARRGADTPPFPTPPPAPVTSPSIPDGAPARSTTFVPPVEPERPPRIGPPGNPRRLSWAELMRRVFAVDVLKCTRCGGPMRILAAIHDPDAVRAILESLGLPSRAPPNLPARPTPD